MTTLSGSSRLRQRVLLAHVRALIWIPLLALSVPLAGLAPEEAAPSLPAEARADRTPPGLSRPAAAEERVSRRPAASFERDGAARRWAQIRESMERAQTSRFTTPSRWDELLSTYEPAIVSATTHEEFADRFNEFAEQVISHFHYFTDGEFAYWLLRSSVLGEADAEVSHVGLFPQRIDGRWFVRGLLEGSPAGADGSPLLIGDVLVSLKDYPFSPKLALQCDEPARIGYRRSPDGELLNAIFTPVRETLATAVRRAILTSIHVEKYDGRRFLYMHAWDLMGGDEYDKLLELQPEVDGLLLDFRDGFGGRPFAANAFLFHAQAESRWTKPALILTDDGTRSAKEIVADQARVSGRVPLVGTPTPGSVTAVGAMDPLGRDGLLMLPGIRMPLEGKPTMPDLEVERPIPWSAGRDPQIDAAKKLLARVIEKLEAPAAVGAP